jgi:hypothetical protein
VVEVEVSIDHHQVIQQRMLVQVVQVEEVLEVTHKVQMEQ